ncbi:hypothetical protein Tsubulata_031983, partial [Turnera subulata]
MDCKKGDNKEGIQQLKQYLHNFGYLNDTQYSKSTNTDANLFYEDLESAITTYQINFSLNPTGVHGVALRISSMHGKTRMKAAASGGDYHPDYGFFRGQPKWPLSKKELTWRLNPGSRLDAAAPIRDFALVSWAAVSPFSFRQVDEDDDSDIKIGFRYKDNDPLGLMDGPGGELAYAYAPTNGQMFLDGDEDWAMNGPRPEQMDFGTVALHELGHILGLQHSSDINAIMFPFGQRGQEGKRGDKKEGIHQLKQYLHRFGYLNNTQYSHSTQVVDANLLDENMERAIRTYQINFNLKPTGVLDAETVSTMMKPRCGLPDIIDGKTRMNASRGEYHLDYEFYSGRPSWPLSKKELTWRLLPGSRQDAIEPIRDYALQSWDSIVPFTFRLVRETDVSDIKIGFRTEKTDPFGQMDGPGGELAYAFGPTVGEMYLDGDENWAINGPTKQEYDMGTVALHELGHVLGLQHSYDPHAIMWPTIDKGVVKDLGEDDIAGMKALYNLPW